MVIEIEWSMTEGSMILSAMLIHLRLIVVHQGLLDRCSCWNQWTSFESISVVDTAL